MEDKILSILTNFGCHWGCRYCVYRENKINIPHTNYKTFGWNQLEMELKEHKGELVSVSGGGDPLYNYEKEENKLWFNKLFSLLDKYNCRLELHTSFLIEDFPYQDCERVVFHLTMPTQINLINNRLFKLPKYVRAVYVVQDYYNQSLIKQIVTFINNKDNSVNELSFRQMIDSNGKPTYFLHDYLKNGHKKEWYYIEQADYNEYFIQNHIEREYLKIK